MAEPHLTSPGADAEFFLRELSEGYRVVGHPAPTAAAPALSSIADASNSSRVGTRSLAEDGSPSNGETRSAGADAAGSCAPSCRAGSPLSPPNGKAAPYKKGRIRKLPRVRKALPFGTLVISGGTTGMSGTLHRVEDCLVLEGDVQLHVRLPS